ncbi:MAG: hypothetical protein QOF21_3098, partial [Actinomycetota bacterium]
MTRRGGKAVAVAVGALALLTAPAATAAPLGSQPASPLVHLVLDGEPYVLQPQLTPVGEKLRALRPPKELLLRGT